jgi:hypothetical protein
MNVVQDPDPFGRLVSALAPWLDQIVIIGGWAHQLYRRHPHAQELSYPALTTLDTDIAVPAKLPIREPDIRSRLLSHGFTEEVLGDDHPPATHYLLSGEASGFYAEFLTPLYGSEYDRRNKRKATIEGAGITSQSLRYIEILLNHPWSIDFESDGRTVNVPIANPVAFLAQKVLIHKKRERHDRAKDILYMHDTLEVFGGRLTELLELWRSSVAPQLNSNSRGIVSRASEVLFGDISDDIRRAAEISAQRALSPEAVQAACRYGFRQVFG